MFLFRKFIMHIFTGLNRYFGVQASRKNKKFKHAFEVVDTRVPRPTRKC